MQRQLVQNFTFILERGQGPCLLTKHTHRWTYSALWYFFPACCQVHFVAFFILKTVKEASAEYRSFLDVVVIFLFDATYKIYTQSNMLVLLLLAKIVQNFGESPKGDGGW